MKRPKITADKAAEAVEELRQYSDLIDRFNHFEKQRREIRGIEHWYGNVADFEQTRKHTRDELYQKADRIASLVDAVFVDGFYRNNPQLSGAAVHSASTKGSPPARRHPNRVLSRHPLARQVHLVGGHHH